MKLAIVRQRYNPFGGAERFVERALAALVAQGAQITLIARDWEDGADADFEKIICRPPSRVAFCGRTGRDRAFARCVQETIALHVTSTWCRAMNEFRAVPVPRRRWRSCRLAGA